ncbi:MAG: type 1 glutamine amidotransferase domain-containing protein [Rhodanobacter sp.]
MKILIVLTSHDKLGNTGNKTGFWLEEFTAPYYVFKDAGAQISLASPAGGQPPLDPKSDAEDSQTDSTRRFKNDAEAQKLLANTRKLADIHATDYDAVFYPGGHGPLWDLAKDKHSITLIEALWTAGKPVALVCHAPAALQHVQTPDGQPLVKGRKVTGFSNSEEAAAGLTDVVPFLLEDQLKEHGGKYAKGEDWSSFVQVDGQLITGQNPASSAAVAKVLLEHLK